jgi:hypothetical protein
METHERYFGKIFAALVKQLVEEDESRSSHVDCQTIFTRLLSEQSLPKQTKTGRGDAFALRRQRLQ